ncbi:MAG: putative DNA binding domain-containing protein [Sphingobacteriales bacterium]|nr:putative DNA binding domain-containing protein [Sphingobacteriales bacterium]
MAFANTKGGVVCIGVSDIGVINGVQIGKETIQKWVNEIKVKTAPSIIPDVEIFEEKGKQVVCIQVNEFPIKPLSFKGRYYKRIDNSNHQLSVSEVADLHLKTINSSWDYYIDPNHSLEHISLDKVNQFLRKIEQRTDTEISYSSLEFLSKMEILREGKLTFGGYLLFVSGYCPISDVQIGRFKSDITIIDSLSLNTDLFSEVDDIIAFIKKHLMVEYIITGEPQRTERFDYPLDAIREIVINMVVHRDYRDSSASIIKMFDNRIEFYNPGKLFGGITIADLLSGNYTSKSRNKLIAKTFKEIGLIERYGSGIHRIQKICEDYGVAPPVFEEIADGFKVTLFNEKLNITEQVTEQVAEQVVEQVPEQVARILIVLEQEMRIKELMEKVGIKHRPTFLYNYLKPALKLGLVEMTVPDKPNSKNQKYRLSESGSNYRLSLRKKNESN